MTWIISDAKGNEQARSENVVDGLWAACKKQMEEIERRTTMKAIIRTRDNNEEISGNSPADLERQADEKGAFAMKVFLDGGSETLVVLAGYGWVAL